MKAVFIYLIFNVFAFSFGAFDFNYQFIGIGILSYLCSLFLFYAYPEKKLIGLLLPLPYFLLYIYMLWMNEFLGLPLGIILLAGAYFGFIVYFYFKNKGVLISVSFFYFVLVFVAGNTLYPAWHSYYGNLLSYKNSYLKMSNSAPIFQATYFDPINNNKVVLPVGKKKILIDLWTTWCAPCVAGIPDFETLMKNNKDTNLIIYSCLIPSETDDPVFIQKILKNRQGNFIMCKDSSILDNLYIEGVPTFLLVDRDGVVLYKGTTSFDLTYDDNIYKIIKRFQ